MNDQKTNTEQVDEPTAETKLAEFVMKEFSAVMLTQLKKKEEEGKGRWDKFTEKDVEMLLEKLKSHLHTFTLNRSPVELAHIANYAMILWWIPGRYKTETPEKEIADK